MLLDDDASRLVVFTSKYISSKDAQKEFFIKLDEELGQKSSNLDIKQLFASARFIVDPPLVPAHFYWWLVFYTLVTIHMALIVGVVLSFFLLPFYAPWYIALPLMAFIWFFSTSRVECKLTEFENFLRKIIGKKRIGGFVGFYFIKPTKYLFKRKPQLLLHPPNYSIPPNSSTG